MLKRSLISAALAMATCLGAAGVADAGVVTFNSGPAFSCQLNTQNSGGMNFAQDYYACYYSQSAPADFPTPLTSGVMAVGYVDTLMTREDDSAFDLGTVDLAFGPFNSGPFARDVANDITTVTGHFADSSSVTVDLNIRYGFQRFTFDWNDLQSVTFGALHEGGYLAFDNIAFDDGVAPQLNTAVPEPATWAMMLTGLFGLGALIRRNRRAAAYATA